MTLVINRQCSERNANNSGATFLTSFNLTVVHARYCIQGKEGSCRLFQIVIYYFAAAWGKSVAPDCQAQLSKCSKRGAERNAGKQTKVLTDSYCNRGEILEVLRQFHKQGQERKAVLASVCVGALVLGS